MSLKIRRLGFHANSGLDACYDLDEFPLNSSRPFVGHAERFGPEGLLHSDNVRRALHFYQSKRKRVDQPLHRDPGGRSGPGGEADRGTGRPVADDAFCLRARHPTGIEGASSGEGHRCRCKLKRRGPRDGEAAVHFTSRCCANPRSPKKNRTCRQLLQARFQEHLEIGLAGFEPTTS